MDTGPPHERCRSVRPTTATVSARTYATLPYRPGPATESAKLPEYCKADPPSGWGRKDLDELKAPTLCM